MANNLGENKEVTCFSNRLIFHCVIFALVLITHIIIFLKIHWMKNIIKLLFLSFSFIVVIYILVSIIPFILIKIKKLQPRINHFKITSKIFFFFSILIGLFFFIIILINTVLFKDFCIECPFNLSFPNFVSNFNENFENKEEYILKRNCRERRCLFNKYDENSKYPYSYLCNYDSEEEFGEKGGELNPLNCKLFEPSYREFFTDETIYKYLDKCFNLTIFYYCGRLQEPKKYELEEDEKCPEKDYIYLIYFLCIYIFIFDIVINIIIWCLQINSYALLSRTNFEAINIINNNNQNINNNNLIDTTNINNNENDNNNNQNDNENDNNNENNNNIENNNQNVNSNIINENNNKQNDSRINKNNTNRSNNENNNNNRNNYKNSTRTRGDTVMKSNLTTLRKPSTDTIFFYKNENHKENNSQNNNCHNDNVDKNNMDNENFKKDSDRNNENNCKPSTLLLHKNLTSKSDIKFNKININSS